MAGVFLAGLSIYQGLLDRVPLIGVAWKTTGYLTGAAAALVSAAVALVSMFLIFQPRWVIAVLADRAGLTTEQPSFGIPPACQMTFVHAVIAIIDRARSP